MAKIIKSNAVVVQPQKIYSDKELSDFHTELLNYKVIKKLSNNETITIIDFTEFHIKNGSLSRNRAVVFNVDTFGELENPPKFEILEEKIRQYKNWCGRVEFSKNKRLEDLEKSYVELSKDLSI